MGEKTTNVAPKKKREDINIKVCLSTMEAILEKSKSFEPYGKNSEMKIREYIAENGSINIPVKENRKGKKGKEEEDIEK